MTRMKPLIDKIYSLERFEGKGGWTYIRIPPEDLDQVVNSGKLKVKGYIDTYAIENYRPMPWEGAYLLPLKAEIRKVIKKRAGDKVRLILYPDTTSLKIPDELIQFLQDEPEAALFFESLSESEQKYYIQWIYSAKRESTRMDRLTKTILRLLKQEKFHARYSAPR